MVKKYKYGDVFQTEAVIKVLKKEEGEIGYFQVASEENNLSFTYKMDKADRIYGLGEQVRGINKRGWIYESNCTDDPFHTETKRSLYAAHNFFIVKGEKQFGVFFDTPSKITFDFGYSDKNVLMVTTEENVDCYLIENDSLNAIVKEFRGLTGRNYIPPKWAFGYQQSRWSYMDAQEVRETVKGYREKQIPIDAVYLDIDYMERYKDFTVNEETFPNFKEFVEEMKKEGIRLIPIIDAGVKVEDGYDVYEEGVANNYFCKDINGKDFTVGVWPGKVHMPDMLNTDARKWFGRKYKVLLDDGIEGFWNDMNEPALFYSEERLQEALEYVYSMRGKNLELNEYWCLKDQFNNLGNNQKDYESFYHNVNGEKVRHDKVHNLFGYYMTRSAGEAFEELEPDKRILMFSRSSYIGMHRYGGIWTGDNMSWWSHLLLNIKMMPSLNMCGFLYTGADLGGFGENTTEDLMMRWLAFGIFTPLMRNHAALGTRNQELYRFTDIESFRRIIELRYAFIPYIYSEFMKASLNDEMYFKPLAFEYEGDALAERVEDQLLLGESLMLAPVYEQNAGGRYVYLPEDMLMVRFRSFDDRDYSALEKGHHYIEAALEEVVLFVRPNKLFPVCRPAVSTEKLKENELELIGYVKDHASYLMYQDDGFTKNYENEANYIQVSVEKVEGNFQPYVSEPIPAWEKTKREKHGYKVENGSFVSECVNSSFEIINCSIF